MLKISFHLLLLFLLGSCVTQQHISERTFSSMEEMMVYIKEDFKKNLIELNDTIYYFPPITSTIPGDTTIIMFGSRKPIGFQKTGNECNIRTKSRVLGDTTIVLFPSKKEEIYLTFHTEYYIDRRKLKILWIEHNR